MLALLVNALLSFSATGTRAKFDTMIASVTLSPKAVEFIDSEKQRLLFKGVLAASEQPTVVNAFAIVYEDLGPVRVAGDLIAKQLSKVATSANERAAASGDVAALSALAASRNLFRLVDSDASGSLDRDELLRSPVLLDRIRAEGESDQAAVERFMSSADADDDGEVSFVEFASAAASEPRLQMAVDDADDADAQEAAALASARTLFDCLDRDASGSLTCAELLRSPSLLALIRNDGEDDDSAVERFMSSADADDDGEVSFVEFASAAASEPRLQMADLALDAALRTASESEGRASGGGSVGGKRSIFGRKAPGERFDDMLAECAMWEAQLDCTPDACNLSGNLLGDDSGGGGGGDGDGDDRMLIVLKGAFAGSRCEPIAEALRVCYLEYSPLRLGGDLIFKLLKRIVASQIASQRP